MADQSDNPTAATCRDLRRNGVPFRVRHFESKIDFAELRENIIVNCTGYGAKAIMGAALLRVRSRATASSWARPQSR